MTLILHEVKKREQLAQLLNMQQRRYSLLFAINNKRSSTPEDFAQWLGASPDELRAWLAEKALPTKADILRFPREIMIPAQIILSGG